MSCAHKGNSHTSISPICKSIWLGTMCDKPDCTRAHPARCKKPECLIQDEGLPRWKVLQCRDWHGRPREKSKFNTSKARIQTKTRVASIPRVQYPKSTIPVWQHQHTYHGDWFKPSPINTSSHFGFYNHSGNGSAAWSIALPMGGSQTWGSQIWSQNLNRAYWMFRD